MTKKLTMTYEAFDVVSAPCPFAAGSGQQELSAVRTASGYVGPRYLLDGKYRRIMN